MDAILSTPFVLVSVLAILALAAIGAMAARQTAKARGTGVQVILTSLRGTVLALLAFLIWQVFWGSQVDSSEDDDPEHAPRQVVVIQDSSDSMDYTGGKTQNRRDLANDVWRQVEHAGKALNPKDVQITRLFFGRNAVTEKDKARLQQDATLMTNAFSQALSRLKADAVLIVSDGAWADGPIPPYILERANNRNVQVSSICTGFDDSPPFDMAITHLDCAEEDPESLTVHLVASGTEPIKTTITLKIDHAIVDERPVTIGPNSKTTFRIPFSKTGWHEYSVEMPKLPNEVSTTNNRACGVFRSKRGDAALFVTSAPRKEDQHIARILRRQFKNLSVKPASELKTINAEKLFIVVTGDIDPHQLPKEIRKRIADSRVALLATGSRYLGNWQAAGVPHFPVRKISGSNHALRHATQNAPLNLSKTLPPALQKISVDQLRLRLVYTGDYHATAQPLITYNWNQKPPPFFITDDLRNPQILAVLSDTTWKWALHPDPKVRQQQDEMWTTTLNWLAGNRQKTFPFDLRLEPIPGTDQTRVIASPVDPDTKMPTTMNLQITQHQQTTSTLPMKRAKDGSAYFGLYKPDVKAPAVVWMQAKVASKPASMRIPLVVNNNAIEASDVILHPENLRATHPNNNQKFAFYPESSKVIKDLLAVPTPRIGKSRPRHRKPMPEIIVVILMLLGLTCEWIIERRLNTAGGGSDDTA